MQKICFKFRFKLNFLKHRHTYGRRTIERLNTLSRWHLQPKDSDSELGLYWDVSHSTPFQATALLGIMECTISVCVCGVISYTSQERGEEGVRRHYIMIRIIFFHPHRGFASESRPSFRILLLILIPSGTVTSNTTIKTTVEVSRNVVSGSKKRNHERAPGDQVSLFRE